MRSAGLVDAFTYEQWGHDVVDAEVMLRHEVAHRPGSAQAARSNRRCRDLEAGHAVEPNGGARRCRDRPSSARCDNRLGEGPRGSVLGVSVHAWFSNDEVSIAPGDTLTLPLTVHNLGDETASYTIVPAGLTASWTTITPGNLTLFGGSQAVVDVTVAPPALSSTTAGPTAIAIRVIPLGDSDDAVVAEATLIVEPFDDCRIVPLQPIQRTRHRATYEFMVENHGNTVASCRLHLIDPSERIDGDFDPPAVGVGPGSATLVRLKARASRGGFRRSTRTLDFEVEAGRQGFAPVTAPMALVQSPTIPAAVIARTAGILALVAASCWPGSPS
jgi:hypothetical protein